MEGENKRIKGMINATFIYPDPTHKEKIKNKNKKNKNSLKKKGCESKEFKFSLRLSINEDLISTTHQIISNHFTLLITRQMSNIYA